MKQVELFGDCGSLDQIREFTKNPLVAGFTTNPTLMAKAGVVDYVEFAAQAAALVDPSPISIGVLSSDFSEMARQAELLSRLGENIFVKIPVINDDGDSAEDLIRDLAYAGIKQNVTAVFTMDQVISTVKALESGPESIISIFAGRIADAGVDPIPLMREARRVMDDIVPTSKLIWASPRELLNLVQAQEAGTDIITMTPSLWAKHSGLGKDLTQFSKETVQMFTADANAAGFEL